MTFGSFKNQLPVELLPGDPQDLKVFVGRIFAPDFSSSFEGQVYTCVVLLALSLIVGGSIVTQRLLRGHAWVLKTYRTPFGYFFIPNALLAFLLVEGAFTIIWIACMFVFIRYCRHQEYVTSIMLWRQLIFVPLFFGAWLACWGTLSAFPDALRYKDSSSLHEFYLRPHAFNILCWFGMFLPIFAIIAPTVLAQQSYAHAYNLYKSQFLTSNLPINQMQELATDIWRQATRAFWYLSVALWIWTVVCILLLIFYTIISIHIVRRLSQQIYLAGRKYRNPETFFFFSPPLDTAKSPLTGDGAAAFPTTAQPDSRSPSRMGLTQVDQRAVWARKIVNLRRIRKMLLIQFALIEATMIAFTVTSGITAGIIYENMRRNNIGPWDSVLWLLVAWSIAIFGVLINASILLRNHAPLLSNEGQEDSKDVRRIQINPKTWFLGRRSSNRDSNEVVESSIAAGENPRMSESTHRDTAEDAFPLYAVQQGDEILEEADSVRSSDERQSPSKWKGSVRSISNIGIQGVTRIKSVSKGRRKFDTTSEADEHGQGPFAEQAEDRLEDAEPTSPTTPAPAIVRHVLRNSPQVPQSSQALNVRPSAFGDWRRPGTGGSVGSVEQSPQLSLQEPSPNLPQGGFTPSFVSNEEFPHRTPPLSSKSFTKQVSSQIRKKSDAKSKQQDAESARERGSVTGGSTTTSTTATSPKKMGVVAKSVAKRFIADIDADGLGRDVAELPDGKLNFI